MRLWMALAIAGIAMIIGVIWLIGCVRDRPGEPHDQEIVLDPLTPGSSAGTAADTGRYDPSAATSADVLPAEDVPSALPPRGSWTIADRTSQCGQAARGRLKAWFDKARLPYPPAKVAIIVLKDVKVLELRAAGTDGSWRLVRKYRIKAASGKAGPKLREGDMQVPEGVYAVESLNPNSRYHLALRVNYPSDFDRRMARQDGRTRLGGDIMIHGSDRSVGCMAMGDAASEDLFVLAADVGIHNVKVIIAPTDLRQTHRVNVTSEATWLTELYLTVRAEMMAVSPR